MKGLKVSRSTLPVAQPPCSWIRSSGLGLHANVAVPARDRGRLERLCRYVARPPVATERLSRMEDGRLLYQLKHRWRDGTTHVVFEPQELVAKLAALVPRPASPRPLPRDPGPVRERARPRRARRRHRSGAGSPTGGESLARSPGRATEPNGSTRAREGRDCRSLQLVGSVGPGRGPGDLRAPRPRARSGIRRARRAGPPLPPARLGRAPAARLRGRRARVPALWRAHAAARGDPATRRDPGDPRLPRDAQPGPTHGPGRSGSRRRVWRLRGELLR